MQELKRFLQEHADKPDDYEIWGGSKRPSSVLTIGTLREIYRLHGRGSFAGEDAPLDVPAFPIAQRERDDAPPSTSR